MTITNKHIDARYGGAAGLNTLVQYSYFNLPVVAGNEEAIVAAEAPNTVWGGTKTLTLASPAAGVGTLSGGVITLHEPTVLNCQVSVDANSNCRIFFTLNGTNRWDEAISETVSGPSNHGLEIGDGAVSTRNAFKTVTSATTLTRSTTGAAVDAGDRVRVGIGAQYALPVKAGAVTDVLGFFDGAGPTRRTILARGAGGGAGGAPGATEVTIDIHPYNTFFPGTAPDNTTDYVIQMRSTYWRL